jgi:hypothetical protein
MWVWAIGAFSLAAAVDQIAIALVPARTAATEPDLHEQCSPEGQSRRRSRVRILAGVRFVCELLDCLA